MKMAKIRVEWMSERNGPTVQEREQLRERRLHKPDPRAASRRRPQAHWPDPRDAASSPCGIGEVRVAASQRITSLTHWQGIIQHLWIAGRLRNDSAWNLYGHKKHLTLPYHSSSRLGTQLTMTSSGSSPMRYLRISQDI